MISKKSSVYKRTKNEIGIHSIRAGDIVGDHTILFSGTGERIELKRLSIDYHSRPIKKLPRINIIQFKKIREKKFIS